MSTVHIHTRSGRDRRGQEKIRVKVYLYRKQLKGVKACPPPPPPPHTHTHTHYNNNISTENILKCCTEVGISGAMT